MKYLLQNSLLYLFNLWKPKIPFIILRKIKNGKFILNILQLVFTLPVIFIFSIFVIAGHYSELFLEDVFDI